MPYHHGIFKRTFTNLFHDEVEPKRGSLVYCKILGVPLIAPPDHTGIYVGNGNIIELNGDGKVRKVDYKEFSGNGPDFNFYRWGFAIYVACDEYERVIGMEIAARRAEERLNSHRSYNLILDNCHQFSSGCITGNPENSDNFFWMLEDTLRREVGASQIKWRVMKGSTDH